MVITPPLETLRSDLPSFRRVPRTGVIYVTDEATRRGFRPDDSQWSNLGQGQPETGPLPGSDRRVSAVAIAPDDHEYAPVAGLWELREAVAGLYNRLYRRGMPSQYSAENVAISGGGRTALTRTAAALGQINLGHFLPDYTAYEELLDIFRLFTPIPISLARDRGYAFDEVDLRREILGRGLGAVLLSNPSNPTGKLIRAGELASWVEVARDLDCALLLDEFYSHYVYGTVGAPGPRSTAIPGIAGAGEPEPTVSAARYVEDVDRDPVVIFDGLTKNWRYPGWRVSWTVGPRSVIRSVSSAGSFLDGGGSRPLQRSATRLLDPDSVLAEARAVQATFAAKRDEVVRRVRDLGMRLDREPEGTFYVWVSLESLPPSITDGMNFFHAALDHQVICVPGVFFDVNPGQRRSRRLSRFHHHVRLSFGPPIEEVRRGLDRLETMIAAAH